MTDVKPPDLNAFLDAVAARRPTPGGGGVAAATGAIACALARMVAAYSPAKNATGETVGLVKGLGSQLERLDRVLRGLVTEDAGAYEALTSASKRLRDDSSHQAEYDTALAVAIKVPLEIAAVGSESLQVMVRLQPVAGRYLRSDLGVAATLAAAAVKAAAYMAYVNTASLPDGDDKIGANREIEQLVAKANAAADHIDGALGSSV